ncbi:MAG: FAD-dependent oxidoreductase [Chloroflexi bacterium]|nr:FAD-dependent oxidoreductase [Chloroflexota bacterium]
MKRVVVVGGGFSGCAAAISAKKAGVESILIERMDTLSGTGPLTGHLIQYIARMETKAMEGGGKDVIEGMESIAIFRQSEFGRKISFIFDATKVEEAMRRVVERAGIPVMLRSRVVDVVQENGTVQAVVLEDGRHIEGDAFVDATGNTGGVQICTKFGVGCVGCGQKCTIYGDRLGVSEAAGVRDLPTKGDYYSCIYIHPDSIAPWLLREMRASESGYYYYEFPEKWQNHDFMKYWPRPERPVRANLGKDKLIYLMPYVKLFVQTLPLDILRSLPGFEDAWMVHPLAAVGNCIKTNPGAPHDLTMRVEGKENLFCCGLRAGSYSALVECIFTGDIAGHNAARTALGIKELHSMPESTMIGFFLKYINERHTLCDFPQGHAHVDPRYVELGMDTMEEEKIVQRIKDAGLLGIYGRKL